MKKNYKKMNITLLPPKKLDWKCNTNVVIFNYKMKHKKLFQFHTHFQIEGVESHN